MCMSVPCLRGGCMFGVKFPTWAVCLHISLIKYHCMKPASLLHVLMYMYNCDHNAMAFPFNILFWDLWDIWCVLFLYTHALIYQINIYCLGHIDLCPDIAKSDIQRNHGFLGQYGVYCYEYVPYNTQWKNAERHCNIVAQGHLTSVMNQDEQDYILRFLKTHNHTDPIWIGLTDSDVEGRWEWITGIVHITLRNHTTFGYTFL